MMSNSISSLLVLFGLGLFQGATAAQNSSLEKRVDKLERENTELNRKLGLLAEAQEDASLGTMFRALGEPVSGFSPAASKVYSGGDGLSVGGYGEARYTDRAGGNSDQADFLRAVMYFGYRFDEHWVFNSEIEFEHASTGESGSVSVEFAYIDYLASEDLSVRTGLLLIPMGFINELHEPTTYLAVTRPETERRIIPSTWRELGLGVAGDAGPISYRVYAVNGFDGAGFSDAGLRGGRQKGSRVKAEDFAIVARADWTDTPGLVAGGSVYYGDSGQNQAGLGSAETTIVEVHGEYRSQGLWLRGLAARAHVDDVASINAFRMAADPTLTAADSVGEELTGAYVEAGYDVMPHLDEGSAMSLSPYVRFETIDTQADVPTGSLTKSANDNEILTFGLNWMPISNIAFKLDYQDYESAQDRWNLSVGYSF